MAEEPSFTLPYCDDFHVHLRQDGMLKATVPAIRQGGVDRCIVMPNTYPPITNCDMARKYKEELEAIDSSVTFLMMLYLSPAIDVDDLEAAKRNGVVGVKSYPRGVTTGSESGVESYDVYAPVFEKMQELGISLHLHGEVPGASVMEAEELFLEQLHKLHRSYPKLKIVLEHCSTKAAVEAVKACGENVAATITAHHLDLTISEVVGCNHNFCKPIPKLPSDRIALREVVASGNPKFFLGSDSAPHPRAKKEVGRGAAAGVYTQAHLLPYLAETFDSMSCIEKLRDFSCVFGARFFGLQLKAEDAIRLVKRTSTIPEFVGSQESLGCDSGQWIVPYRAGQSCAWSLEFL
ncbi:hypothetical protein FOZ62_014730 [Perkinsus olseni]|uniref:dihydroorotase n=1 Tax=Perkinsus olseni TaxID=32597 RepID=A0A7J6TRE5_PEROL|nr:hypothetical protein FOZ62_014730 [Perkinsus olseni]